MPITLQTIQSYLDNKQVDHTAITHEPAASADEYHAILGTAYEQQAKALFIQYKKAGQKHFAILAIQSQKRADLKKVAQLLDASSARLGTIDQLTQVTGCHFGELPPLAGLFKLTMLLDKDLLAEHEIYFNAGSLSTSIKLNPSNLAAIENPVLY